MKVEGCLSAIGYWLSPKNPLCVFCVLCGQKIFSFAPDSNFALHHETRPICKTLQTHCKIAYNPNKGEEPCNPVFKILGHFRRSFKNRRKKRGAEGRFHFHSPLEFFTYW